jgi:hypothetical protein
MISAVAPGTEVILVGLPKKTVTNSSTEAAGKPAARADEATAFGSSITTLLLRIAPYMVLPRAPPTALLAKQRPTAVATTESGQQVTATVCGLFRCVSLFLSQSVEHGYACSGSQLLGRRRRLLPDPQKSPLLRGKLSFLELLLSLQP